MFEKYLVTVLLAIIPVAVSALLFLLLKRTSLKNLSDKGRHVLTGIVFGALLILETEIGYSVDVGTSGHVLINCVDVIPACAGFIFGGPAGIIAAIIGIVFRGLSALWCIGLESIVAEIITIIISAAFAFLAEKYLLDKKRPPIFLGFIASVTLSQLHILVIAITSGYESVTGFVTKSALPTTICDIIALTLSLVIVRLIAYKKLTLDIKSSPNEKKFKYILTLSFVILFVFSLVLSAVIFIFVSRNRTSLYLKSNLETAQEFVESDLSPDVETISDIFSNDEYGYLIIADMNTKILSGVPDPLTYFGIDNFEPRNYLENTLYTLQKNNATTAWMYRKAGDYYLVYYISNDAIYYLLRSEVLFTFGIDCIILFLLFILIFILFKKFVINNVKTANVQLGKLIGETYSVSHNGTYEDEFVLFDSSLAEYTQNVTHIISNEMKLAGDIQLHALPLPKAMLTSISINAFIAPARQVGGDFYDYFTLDKNRSAILIADVSGKGTSAALFMMRAKAAVRAVSAEESKIDIIFNKVNQILCEGNTDGIFVTMWMGIIDINTGHVSYVNAAQGNIIVRHPFGNYEFLECSPELPLGILPSKKYSAKELHLLPGSRIFLYTDGVTDAANINEEMFGEENLLEYINNECMITKGNETISSVMNKIIEFSKNVEQFDDITMLTADFFGKMDNLNIVSKTFTAADEYLDEAADFVNSVINNNEDLDDAQLMEIDVSLEEIFVNIAHYAYPGTSGTVTIEAALGGGIAAIRLSDSGTPFNPLSSKAPDSSIPLQERKEGGLGIAMVKECMDYVDYTYDDEKNIFTMIKIVK